MLLPQVREINVFHEGTRGKWLKTIAYGDDGSCVGLPSVVESLLNEARQTLSSAELRTAYIADLVLRP